jgi:hypothetical protein
MTNFIGDYICKIDIKGRVMLPAALKKQMSSTDSERFVIKKDIFASCLVLYPMEEWERQNRIIRAKVNPYKKEHNQFLRAFYKGTADIVLDGNTTKFKYGPKMHTTESMVRMMNLHHWQKKYLATLTWRTVNNGLSQTSIAFGNHKRPEY